MGIKAVILTVILGLLLDAQATQLFSNTGTTPGGWNSVNIDHKGTVAQVANIVYEGPTAIKVTQTYDPDPSYTGRYHSEVVHDNGYRRGDTGFYGFMFRLSESWEFTPGQSYNLAQFIADFRDSGCDDWMPSSMIWLVGSQLYSRVKTGTICSQTNTTFPLPVTVRPGVWHKVMVQANWKSDATGYYKMWFDGAKVLEKFDIATTIAHDREFSFRVGLYANGWFDDKGMKGNQPFRQVWYDEVATGTTFADADPDQW